MPARRARTLPCPASAKLRPGLVWSALALVASAALAAPRSPGQQALADYLASSPARVAFHAVRLDDGEVLATRDADRPMVPASVQKLATSAVALAALGRGFVFTTTLATLGDDLLVIGDGDPTTGDPVLAEARKGSIYDLPDAWAAALAERGVRRILGDLVLDDGVFQAGRHGDWPVRQRLKWFCAPAAGLNFNDNCLDVQLSIHGRAVQAIVAPTSRHIRVVNRTRLGAGNLWHVRYSQNDATVTITGKVAKSMTRPMSVAVNEPAMLFGRVLADRLARAGISIEGSIIRRSIAGGKGMLPAGTVVAAVHATPLPVVLGRMNKRSLNLTAECLFLRVAAHSLGQGTFPQAAEVATGVLTKHYGLPGDQFMVADGSGMSRNNRLSAAVTVTLLRRLASGQNARLFLDSLSIAGVDGSLARRLTACRGRVIGKTGSLSGVSALAGYVLDGQGRPAVAFAVFCNNVRGGNWRAKEVQDAMIRGWARATRSAAPHAD